MISPTPAAAWSNIPTRYWASSPGSTFPPPGWARPMAHSEPSTWRGPCRIWAFECIPRAIRSADEFLRGRLAEVQSGLTTLPCSICPAKPAEISGVLSAIPGGPPTHLLAIERVGPSHTFASIYDQYSSRTQFGLAAAMADRFRREVPEADLDRCHTMRGIDITDHMRDAAFLFDRSHYPHPPVTIGIGDGGNEIGMGKVPRDTIRRRHVPCGSHHRVPGRDAIIFLSLKISNWERSTPRPPGSLSCADVKPPQEWFDLDHERAHSRNHGRARPPQAMA